MSHGPSKLTKGLDCYLLVLRCKEFEGRIHQVEVRVLRCRRNTTVPELPTTVDITYSCIGGQRQDALNLFPRS
ncbi:hypothetical protein TNCT_216761 [Trichonephila clavata]|uniref:Uncharacterized protein n=1 Tax=Trichonephila clavata TaxID=2740835 RepID=A0A8X6JCN3_TRICU|nr:hypothetical protein TNCT_216761 [Trichonephila clavata]